MTGTPWNADLDATLRQLWAMGKNIEEIKAVMPGKTRPAIVSRAAHLKLPRRSAKLAPKTMAARNKKRDKAIAKAKARLAGPDAAEGISWITAAANACKNVIGDPRRIMICGKPRVNDSYCADCAPKMKGRAW